MEPSFSGYVTKANLKCADGRTIASSAFKHQDGMKVPLVYQHNHDDVEQVLGHAILKHTDEGVWGDAYLNNSAKALAAKAAVEHGDLDKFSIWAKDLDERIEGFGDNRQAMVHDGVIQEVSLVLAGANPGANISSVLMHSGLDADDNMMVVGFEIKHADVIEVDNKPDVVKPDTPLEEKAEDGQKTVADVLGTLTPEQQTAVNSFIGDVVEEAVTVALTEEPEVQHGNMDSTQKGTPMTRNVFDRSTEGNAASDKPQLKHSDVSTLLTRAKESKTDSLREMIRSGAGKELLHADTYGVENIEILFPDAQSIMSRPTFIDRRQEWVRTFMAGTSHSPFSRIKTMYADITADEARAKGYIKANQKVEEVFPVFKRTTGPAMVYKKQKLDRQDIIDIVDFDVVAWMKAEMRGKLDEEIARAALFGDNRPVMINGELNPDKIQEPTGNSGDGIRSIFNDNDLYATRYSVQMPANPQNTDWNILLDTVTESGEHYLGSGNKTAFMSFRVATKLLTIRDGFGHRVYKNLSEVAGDMDVTKIERVPTDLMPENCLAMVLDLRDYNFGTNKGGEITLFDDFDIDFNQFKYLIETYLSGALTLPYSAQIFMSVESTSVELEPVQPLFEANTISIPTQPGVKYTNAADGTTLASGSTVVLDESTKTYKVEAIPTAGYHFNSDSDAADTWTFRYKA